MSNQEIAAQEGERRRSSLVRFWIKLFRFKVILKFQIFIFWFCKITNAFFSQMANLIQNTNTIVRKHSKYNNSFIAKIPIDIEEVIIHFVPKRIVLGTPFQNLVCAKTGSQIYHFRNIVNKLHELFRQCRVCFATCFSWNHHNYCAVWT